MSTIAQRTENFKELYKQHLVSIGDNHDCENCKTRREGQINAFGSNTEHFPELMVLSEEEHFQVILRMTEAQIALVESFRPDPVKDMLQKLFSGEFPGAEVEVLSQEEFIQKMQETPIVPLNTDGKTHC